VNRNPFTKAPKAKLATAALATPKEWRGRSGETVAQRKARQERAQPDILAQQFRLREFKPAAKAKYERPAREPYAYPARQPIASPKELREKRQQKALASGAISFRPLGSALTMRVRPNLRFSRHCPPANVRPIGVA